MEPNPYESPLESAETPSDSSATGFDFDAFAIIVFMLLIAGSGTAVLLS